MKNFKERKALVPTLHHINSFIENKDKKISMDTLCARIYNGACLLCNKIEPHMKAKYVQDYIAYLCITCEKKFNENNSKKRNL